MNFSNNFSAALLVLILLNACTGGGGDDSSNNNAAPTAFAGDDQNVEIGSLVTLDGSSYDADGDSSYFDWAFIQRPNGSTATLVGADTANPTFTADLEGTYEISLTVFDGIENSTPDSVLIYALPWVSESPMPTDRGYLTVSEVNGRLYAIGGGYSVSISNVSFTQYDLPTVEEYNPVTDTWTAKTPMPTSRAAHAASVVNGRIYVIGGAVADSGSIIGGTLLSTVEEYDPTTDTWTTKTSMPTPRSFITSSVVNGRIYVFGGRAAADRFRVDEYDPVTDTWSNKTDRPSNPYGSSSSAVNGRIYLIGGNAGGSTTLTVDEYDPVSDTWASKSSTPVERSYLGTTVLNGEIYAIGGIGNTYYRTVEKYDPTTDTWTIEPSMITARSQLASSSANGRIYAIGGENGQGEIISSVESYQPN